MTTYREQGKWYRNVWKKQYDKTTPQYIEQGSLPSLKNLKTIRENFQSMSSTSTGNTSLDRLLSQFDEYYEKYLQLSKQLATDEEEYNNILVRNNELPAIIRPYLGLIVKDQVGVNYYITRYGHLRKFPPQVWETRDTDTCSNPDGVIPVVSNELLSQCLPAPDMNAYEPCKQEGKVVRNGSKMEYKWVNAQGQARIFSTENEYENNLSCPAEYNTLATENYSAISVVAGDSIMTPTSKCSVLIQDKALQQKIIEEKQELIDVLHNMLTITSQIESTDTELSKEVANNRQSLSIAISNLTQEIKNQKRIQEDNDTLRGKWRNIVIQERMEYYQYLGVASVSAIVAGILLHQLFSSK